MFSSKILNRIKLYCFLKFIVYELNSEMVKSGMVLLTEREKADITNADVTANWKLQTAAGTVVNARERS
jgi:cation transport regulator ChaC